MAASVIPGSQDDIERTKAVLERMNAKAAPDDATSLLREIAQELTDCRRYLGRLVAMEEERREGERQMEALAEALGAQSGGDPPTSGIMPVAELDWYRDTKGYPRERGTDRLLTMDEYKAVTYSPRREAHREQSR